ncbi:MAG: hypothetical protein MR739_04495 [Spirochaetia bacterium]|nr:hypothetical protein [Spirochaetia bacterium]MCI6443145.1 hypothetical protein [Spirochaetia bacterium]
MKKLISVFALCALFCTGIFAQEDSKSSNYGLERPLRFEVGYAPLFGVDFRGAYMFPINDVLRCDVGAEANVFIPGPFDVLAHAGTIYTAETRTFCGIPFNFLVFGSLWWWDFYVSYGFGLGINTAGGAAFLPFDARIGWQPGARKNNRFAFKLETVLFGNTYGDNRYEYINGTEGKKLDDISVKTHFVFSPRLNIGLAVRF